MTAIDFVKWGRRQLMNARLRCRAMLLPRISNEDVQEFTCSVCGGHNKMLVSLVRHRECRSCYHCGSNRRFRTVSLLLSRGLFDKEIPLDQFPIDKSIVGYGMSDAAVYAERLSRKFNYVNTYYHKEPLLDITAPSPQNYAKADFLISSDVFEHVAPPVERAFKNLHEILKPGGICIFSVPYDDREQTLEHFPNLHDYYLEKIKGTYKLFNTTKEGRKEVFDKLNFHGGPGTTLEMRVFGRSDLEKMLRDAGFVDIEFQEQVAPEWGIDFEATGGGHVLSMRRPS